MNLKNIATKTFKVILWLGLLSATIFTLATWSEIQKNTKVPATLGSQFVYTDSWDKGYFNATGTWNSAGEKRVDKLNSVEITCILAKKMCAVSVASLNQYNDIKPFLSSSLDIFDVVRWDANVINFKEEKQCAETAFSINRETKTVSALRKYHSTVSGCSPDSSKEMTYTLVNGYDVYSGLIKENDNVPMNVFILTLALAMTIYGIYRVLRKPSEVK